MRSRAPRNAPHPNLTGNDTNYGSQKLWDKWLLMTLVDRVGQFRGKVSIPIVDQGVFSLAGVLPTVLAARIFADTELSRAALLLLAISSALLLQRATILTPGLASQRTIGKSFVPASWAWFAVPSGLFAIGVGLFIEVRVTSVLLLGLAAMLCCAQDTLRHRAFSLDAQRLAVIADGVLLASVLLVFVIFSTSERELSITWFLIALTFCYMTSIACYLLVAISQRSATKNHAPLKLRPAFVLGRWSGLDTIMSIAANFAPLVFTLHQGDPSLSGVYRTGQVVLGPLNVITAGLILSSALTSHQLTSRLGLSDQARWVATMRNRLLVVSVLLVPASLGVLAAVSNVKFASHPVALGAITFSGVVGAVTAVYSAASQSLGMQSGGVMIRVICLTGTAGILVIGSVLAAREFEIDVVGLSMAFVSSVSVLGWLIAYKVGRTRALRSAGLPAPQENTRGVARN